MKVSGNPRETDFQLVRGLGGNTIGNTAMYGLKLQEGKPEKHPDPAGIGPGKESTPVPGYINDCCLMDYGDWENTCTNGEDDACETPKNEPIKNSAEILKINAGKIPMWLRKGENIEKLFKAFPDDFKQNWAKRDVDARRVHWTEKINAASELFQISNSTRSEITQKYKIRFAHRRNLESFPIFENSDCISFDHQKYKRVVRNQTVEIDTGFVDMILSDDFLTKCVESDKNFVKSSDGALEWSFEFKFLRHLVPRATVLKNWDDFFIDLDNCSETSCVEKVIDKIFDSRHRKKKSQNLFIDPSGIQEKNLEQMKSRAQLQTMSEYEPWCPKGCKSCLCAQKGLSERKSAKNSNQSGVSNKFYLAAKHYVWLMDQFEPKLSTFSEWKAKNYSPGSRCKNSPLLEPRIYNKPDVMDISGRFCRSRPEPTGCAVPDHQGPVGNGFNIVAGAVAADRRPGHKTEEIEIKGFGDYTKFAKCLLDVMHEIEGIAHFPELDEKLKHTAGAEDTALWREPAKDENYDTSGVRNGLNPRSLKSKKSNIRGLTESSEYFASEPVGVKSRYLHGSGSRFIQPNNDEYYIEGCLKYLQEASLPDAYEVPGNSIPGSLEENFTVNSVLNKDHAGDGPGSLDYDMDGSLLGYYPLKV